MEAKTVGDVLRQKGSAVETIAVNDTVYNAVKKMAKKSIGALLVVHSEPHDTAMIMLNIAGIVTERDYARKVILENRSSKETSVEDIMTGSVVFADETMTIERALDIMTEKHIRHLPVAGGAIYDGRRSNPVIGIVSIGDLVKAQNAARKREIEILKEYIYGR